MQVVPLCRNREASPSDYYYHFAAPADRDRFATDCTSWDDPAAETADERIPIALERLPAGKLRWMERATSVAHCAAVAAQR